ncbi:hypothetical protein PIB30_098562, partial [Stylosanthes scabra]|nr:hypothetical protein [Stylosanthes scabra]
MTPNFSRRVSRLPFRRIPLTGDDVAVSFATVDKDETTSHIVRASTVLDDVVLMFRKLKDFPSHLRHHQ